MSLSQKHAAEIKQILAKYPADHKRSAVMPLLYLAQREEGYITKAAMQEIAQLLGMSLTDIGALAGFYTLFHDRREGKYRIQVCTDLPCALRGADQFLEELCSNLGIKLGETTPDGLITLEAVTCLAGCDKAPMFQLQSPEGIEYHEDMTVDRTLELIQILKRAGREVA
jgi:NADH-quinone oxidoreductase subunit E